MCAYSQPCENSKLLLRNYNMLNMPYNWDLCYYTEKIPKTFNYVESFNIHIEIMLVHACKLLVSYNWGFGNITFYNIITLFVNTYENFMPNSCLLKLVYKQLPGIFYICCLSSTFSVRTYKIGTFLVTHTKQLL